MASKKIRLGIVVAEFNMDITHKMMDTAIAHIKKLGAETAKIIHVPGVFDMPIAIKKLLELKGKNSIDAVITLGCVIQGETAHDELITYTVANRISKLSLKYNKPVTLGISGPRMTRRAGEARAEEYGRRASEAAIELVHMMREK